LDGLILAIDLGKFNTTKDSVQPRAVAAEADDGNRSGVSGASFGSGFFTHPRKCPTGSPRFRHAY
jgi:hypothetical protein